ncbi:MAG: hypothetical protein IPM54_07020 [Polyangiaceae bacterium]|nr:hypothetical protein [Polyangiaceae bacterium]
MHHLTRSFFKSLVLASTFAATAAIMPADALACGAPQPGLTSHIPADGAWYPANGIVLFDGYSISLEQVTVTVDGAPATLVDASSSFSTHVAALAVRVSPKPMPEQKVTISGAFCAGCAPESFTFTARADDLVAPEGVVSAEYGVHDYPDFKSGGGDCQSDSDMGIWVHAQTIPANEEEAPSIIQVEAFADTALTKPLGSKSSVISTPEFVWGYRVTTDALQGATPTNVCFRLSTKDLSGNDGPEPIVLCNACYTRTEAGSMAFSPPSEPTWGESDIIKGGPCDWGVGVGGGDDSGSCSYQASQSANGSAPWALVALALAGVRAACKRTQRARK